MIKISKKINLFVMVFVLLFASFLLTACGGTGDGIYKEKGLTIEVKNHSANIIDIENDVENIEIPAMFREIEIEGVKENSFESSSLKKISFEKSRFSDFSIDQNSFNNSSVEVIENLPANANIYQNSFAGLKNLKSISVYGEGSLSVEDGALIEMAQSWKNLVLLPAGSQPTANFENGVYTITGYKTIYSNSLSYNQFIKDIVIAEDITLSNKDVCSNVKLNSVTIQTNKFSDLVINKNAFTIHKDLKIYVPATTNQEMNDWLSYSKNLVYDYNWLVHPVDCHKTGAHMHGARTQVRGNIDGYDYEEGEKTITIKNGSIFQTIEVPDYMFKVYEG